MAESKASSGGGTATATKPRTRRALKPRASRKKASAAKRTETQA